MTKTQDLVVKMTINSQDFDAGLKNAKNSMKGFGNETGQMSKSFNAAMSGIVKKIGLVGIALKAKDGFKQFATSTEEMADGFRNEMGAMGDAWKSFMFQVNNGNFQGFKDIINYARQARQAMDELGDAAALFGVDYAESSANATELLSTIQKKKKAGQDYSGELEAYNKIVDAMREDQKLADDRALKALEGIFGTKGISRGDYGVSYMELAQLARKAAAGAFPDVEKLKKAYNTVPDVSELNDFDIDVSGQSPVKRLEKEWGRERFAQAEFLRALGNITTEEKETIEKILSEMSGRKRIINEMDKRLNRYLTAEEGGGGTKTTATPQSRQSLDLIPILPALKEQDEGLAIIEKINKSIERQNELMQTNAIIVEVGQMMWQNRINKMNEYATAINSLGSAFSSLSEIAGDDSGFRKFASVLGTVATQIGGLIQTYASLVAVEAVAESIKAGNGIPFPYNLALIASAGAALAAIIATIKSQSKSSFAGSYAKGGIVPGTSYSGDKLWARVNSGEMILTRQQSAALLSGGGGQVQFIIEGSQLKGVLKNYESIQNL